MGMWEVWREGRLIASVATALINTVWLLLSNPRLGTGRCDDNAASFPKDWGR